MFIQPAFIKKNTQELREKLRVLGYRVLPDLFNFPCLSINNGLAVPADTLNRNGGINCEENEDLFLAIAALRDDSDFMQWFIWGKDTSVAKKGDWSQCRVPLAGEDILRRGYSHKASVKELIEHFSGNINV